jgi:2,3-bisphosphoglycerate-independent phosphoglycerate mutase
LPGHPEMSVELVANAAIDTVSAGTADLIVVNIANLDQIGHLGNLTLATQAAAHVDRACERIAAACRTHGWTALFAADHGNADCVLDDAGRPFGSHTRNPIPFTVSPAPGHTFHWVSAQGSLANVAASVLATLGVDVPTQMQASLFRFDQ